MDKISELLKNAIKMKFLTLGNDFSWMSCHSHLVPALLVVLYALKLINIVRYVLSQISLESNINSQNCFSLMIILASLYVLLYLVSLAEISAFVNSRKDMLCIKSFWKDRFLVAVDSDEKIIGTIAFTENKDVHWKGVPIEGETVEINSVLGKFEVRKKYLIDWPAFLKHLLDFSYIQFFKRRCVKIVK